jgi:hypothetical protein
MHSLKLCKQYLNAVLANDLAEALSLFVAGAQVVAPLSGNTSAEAFHQKLFNDVRTSNIRIKNIFGAVNSMSSVALHFSHSWELEDGGSLDFEGINVFDLSEDGTKFTKLTILYDSAPIRQRLSESRHASDYVDSQTY